MIKTTLAITRFGKRVTAHNTNGTQTSIEFAPLPMLVFHNRLTKIDYPERFGPYATDKQKHDYTREFVAGIQGNSE